MCMILKNMILMYACLSMLLLYIRIHIIVCIYIYIHIVSHCVIFELLFMLYAKLNKVAIIIIVMVNPSISLNFIRDNWTLVDGKFRKAHGLFLGAPHKNV